MSPNFAFVVIGTLAVKDTEKVWIDTLHTTANRAAKRIEKLKEDKALGKMNFQVHRTNFGHRHNAIYTNLFLVTAGEDLAEKAALASSTKPIEDPRAVQVKAGLEALTSGIQALLDNLQAPSASKGS